MMDIDSTSTPIAPAGVKQEPQVLVKEIPPSSPDPQSTVSAIGGTGAPEMKGSTSPSTPGSSTTRRRTPTRMSSATGQAPASVGRSANGIPRSVGTESRRSKPVFTSSMSFPEARSRPLFGQEEEAELSRSQRRSKVEAISRIDKAGVPIPLTAGPAATSFLPASTRQSSAGPSSTPSGPSPSRNPLHKPPVVNPKFDIKTVRTVAPRHAPDRSGSRLFGLEECPVYHPTPEEFSDPMRYIDSIGPSARPYGICKVVPPEGWQMPFSLETESFRFRTRLQRLNSLEAASRAKVNFLEQLSMYHLQRDDSTVTIPKINRRPVDLWTLRKEVNKLGGHLEVNRIKAWPTIAEVMGYDQAYALELKEAYTTIVLPFDNFAVRARSVSGSPLTPLQSTNTAKSVPPPGFVGGAMGSPGSPTVQKSKGRMSGVSLPSRSSPRSRMPSGNAPPPAGSSIPGVGPNSATTAAAGPSTPPSGAQTWVSAPPGFPPIKIKVPGFSSRDGSESELSEEETPAKRRPTPIPEYQKGEVCEVCRRGDGADKILLCDGCDRGFHIYCLDPPLSSVPSNEEWFCTPCLLSQGDDYGFGDGEDHSIPSFQARDASFASAWFQSHWAGPSRRRVDSNASAASSSSSLPNKVNGSGADVPVPSRRFGRAVVTEDDVEREFWRLTESHSDTVEVEYGADVHSTTHGSASPSTETHPLDVYSRSGWNLNNMPILPESLLRYIKSDISGMTVPWIYVGMLFSTFCWHNEDHYTYSVNYMHWGETKTWYGIPGSDSDKFEEAIKSEAPELFEQQPSLLYQLVTMMNPGRVREAGVRVVACDQRPNEFVITFPKAYHCGFNHGINFNEAVNFALPDWLPEGKECVTRYKQHSKPPVFSHNELLITITLYSDTIKTALWLQDSLAQMVVQETARREALRNKVPLLTETLVEEDTPEDQYQCCHCKGFCYLSQVTCKCTKLVACVDHADQLCGCPPEKRTLRMRYSEAQLEEILAEIQARAAVPEAWRVRFNALMTDSPRPPLKSMRALLADGEKIQYPLPEIDDLRAMVNRANDWVDRATAVTTRKTAARRRKGRQATEEDEPDEGRNPRAIARLLHDADKLAFDSPEIAQLRQIQLSINSFRSEAAIILSTPEDELDREKCRTALVLGQGLGIELEEVTRIQTLVNRLEWIHKLGWEVDDREMQYQDVVELLEDAKDCDIPPDNAFLVDLRALEVKGRAWKHAAERLLASKSIELDDITALVEGQELTPTVLDLLLELESIRKTALGWQTTARQQLEGQGTITSAQRLCKAVRTAHGAQGRVNVPEIAQIQAELDFQSDWLKAVATTLRVGVKQVVQTLDNVHIALQQQLQPEDERPNDQHSCFCRTPPLDIMVKCTVCRGLYHPKCVNVSAKNLNQPFKCAMCEGQPYDDRPSMHELALFEDPRHWNFVFPTPEQGMISDIVTIAIEFARAVQPYLDPSGVAVPCRDVELLNHFARKLYNLPISLDTYNPKTNQRIVFEDWLYKRIHDARNPAKARTRPRKPRLVLREAKEKQFACICSEPPPDALVMVNCSKCGQVYHATCVFAPEDAVGAEAKHWRCPCCTVKEGKHYHKGAEVRVQMTVDRLGSDTYVDYRTTVNAFSQSVLEYTLPPPKGNCILLECINFIGPVIPDEYEPPSIPLPGQNQGFVGGGNGFDGDEDMGDGSVDGGGGSGPGEPKKKKRRLKAAAAKLTVPMIDANVNGSSTAINGSDDLGVVNGETTISGTALSDHLNGHYDSISATNTAVPASVSTPRTPPPQYPPGHGHGSIHGVLPYSQSPHRHPVSPSTPNSNSGARFIPSAYPHPHHYHHHHPHPQPSTPRSILDSQPSHRAQNHPFGSPTQAVLSPNRSTFSHPITATASLGFGFGTSPGSTLGTATATSAGPGPGPGNSIYGLYGSRPVVPPILGSSSNTTPKPSGAPMTGADIGTSMGMANAAPAPPASVPAAPSGNGTIPPSGHATLEDASGASGLDGSTFSITASTTAVSGGGQSSASIPGPPQTDPSGQ